MKTYAQIKNYLASSEDYIPKIVDQFPGVTTEAKTWLEAISNCIASINKLEPISGLLDFEDEAAISKDLNEFLKLINSTQEYKAPLNIVIKHPEMSWGQNLTRYAPTESLLCLIIPLIIEELHSAIEAIIFSLSNFAKVAIGEPIK